MEFLHQEYELGTDGVVEVTLKAPVNVILLDPANDRDYAIGSTYHYYGVYADQSPVR